MIRDDLSDKLVHLTRVDTDQIAAGAFLSILREKRLQGGIRDIKGQYRCVCFSEAPLSKLGGILSAPSAHGFRYKPFGIMVSKQWLFEKGGRPVIYQPSNEYRLLPEELRYRHVTYEPDKDVDITWEREWRIKIDGLELEPDHTTVVVPNREWEDWLMKGPNEKVWRRAAAGRPMPMSMIEQPWHIIVLEDLGVPMPSIDPPQGSEEASQKP